MARPGGKGSGGAREPGGGDKPSGKSKKHDDRKSNAPTVTNRNARFKYHIEESVEAGVVLIGSEVKAIRAGKANLTDSYVRMRGTEAFLVGCHIGAYESAGQFNHEAKRERKMLLHRRELDRLMGRVREKGLTAIVTKLYFKDGRAAIRERAVKKEMDRAMKERRR